MLETIWFILWGVLWGMYFILDGYDLGMGMLMPALAKDNRDRRIIYNAQGPFWDGNEVWLLTAGGATFAAFPAAYAALFSGMYTALMLLLFCLILRGVSFEFRNKVDSEKWAAAWDKVHTVSSFLIALLVGVAFANIFQGLPLNAEGVNQGGLFDLLNPFGLLGGVLFLLFFGVHGCLWLAIKSEGPIHDRAVAMAEKLWSALAIVLVLFVGASAFATNLLDNYMKYPLLLPLPILAVVGLFMQRVALGKRTLVAAWGWSAATIAFSAFYGVAGLYPALLPSSLNPSWSKTIWNSASSPLTLQIMLGVALCVVPVVLAYQAWAHALFSHKITDEDLAEDEAY